MCKICEAMPLNQLYVSPYTSGKDLYSRMPLEDVKTLTRVLIQRIVDGYRQNLEAERLTRTGQTSLY